MNTFVHITKTLNQSNELKIHNLYFQRLVIIA